MALKENGYSRLFEITLLNLITATNSSQGILFEIDRQRHLEIFNLIANFRITIQQWDHLIDNGIIHQIYKTTNNKLKHNCFDNSFYTYKLEGNKNFNSIPKFLVFPNYFCFPLVYKEKLQGIIVMFSKKIWNAREFVKIFFPTLDILSRNCYQKKNQLYPRVHKPLNNGNGVLPLRI